MSEITDKLRQEAGFWSSAQGACEVSLELQLGTGSLFGEAADYIDRLEAALTKISSPTQSTGLLWWQIEARAALNTTPGAHDGR
jgi:hypothetical protein